MLIKDTERDMLVIQEAQPVSQLFSELLDFNVPSTKHSHLYKRNYSDVHIISNYLNIISHYLLLTHVNR